MDGLFGDMEDKKRRLRPAEEATIMGVIERMLEESIKDPDFLMNNLASNKFLWRFSKFFLFSMHA